MSLLQKVCFSNELPYRLTLIEQQSIYQSSVPLFMNLLRRKRESILNSGRRIVLYAPLLTDRDDSESSGVECLSSFKQLMELNLSNNDIVVFADLSIDIMITEQQKPLIDWIIKHRQSQIVLNVFKNALTNKITSRIQQLAECLIKCHHLQRYIDARHDFKFLHFHSKTRLSSAINHLDNDPNARMLLELQVIRQSGKFTTEEAVISLVDGFCVSLEDYLKSGSLANNHDEPEVVVAASHQVPFNLQLTKEQETARAKVNLPYMTSQAAESAPVHQTISYSMDDVDDFDDEDPDADLEI